MATIPSSRPTGSAALPRCGPRWRWLPVALLLVALGGHVWAATPANDNFAARIDLGSALPRFTTGNNAFATSEPGEPILISSGATTSVWWKWTAPVTGRYTVSTKGSSFDTVLGVYSGTVLSTLSLMNSNDEYFPHGDAVTSGYTSMLSFTAISGSTYSIKVAGWAGGSGSIALSIQATPTITMTAPTAPGELGIAGQFTASLSNTTVDKIPLSIAVAGSATANVDYTDLGTLLTIPANTAALAIPVNAIDDALVEGNETVQVTMGASTWSNYLIGTPSVAVLSIVDNEQPVVFVDALAAVGGDGTKWGTAFKDLPSALANAVSGNQVWVRSGTYKPTTGSDAAISFTLKAGAGLYGGFKGNETALFQRDWRANATVLSGNIGNLLSGTDNTTCVVVSPSGGLIDGFTIRDGYATATFGAGMRVSGASTVSNCLFLSNAGWVGGALSIAGGSSAITGCVFQGNTVTYLGGAIYGDPTSTGTRIVNCLFSGNSTSSGTFGGGAVFNNSVSAMNIGACTFSGNSAALQGGAVYNYNCSPNYDNCILWGNSAPVAGSGQMFNEGSAAPVVATSDMQGGLPTAAVDGGGNLAIDPQFVNAGDPKGADGVYATVDDGLALRANSPCLDAGSASGAPGSDLAGTYRPQGAGHDLGAYEVPIVYVDSLASGANDGTSWSSAFTSLQAAIDSTAGGAEIWVKTAVYKPTTGSDRTVSFRMRSGAAIYGGFNGSETARDQRDWRSKPTVLSGDIGAVGVASDNSYHVVVAASGSVLDGFIVRDGRADGGFASPTYYGYSGGMLIHDATPTVRNCAFILNYGTYGGAIHTYNPGGVTGAPLIERCVFAANVAGVAGGGAYIQFLTGGQQQFTNCLFASNSAPSGGAVYNSSSAAFTNCTIGGNSATASTGGGIYSSSVLALRNSILWGNTSLGAGPQVHAAAGSPTATNCTFDNGALPTNVTGSGNLFSDPLFLNLADPAGADRVFATADDGLALNLVSPCINAGTATGAPAVDLAGNLRPLGGGIEIGAYERAPVIHVDTAATGGPINGSSWNQAYRDLASALTAATAYGSEIWVADGTYRPTAGVDRSISFQLKPGVPVYGGFAGTETSLTQRNWAANPTVLSGDIGTLNLASDNSYHVVRGASNALLDGFAIIRGNANVFGYGIDSGGGGLVNPGTSTTVANCIFKDNNAWYAGGAVYSFGACAPVFRNCLFTANTCNPADPGYGYGGAFECENGANAIVINSTFTGNLGNYGGATETAGCTLTLQNCILWGDSSPETYNNGTTLVANCDIQGSGGSSAWVTARGENLGGNLDLNPQFVDLADPDGADNLFGTSDDGLRLTTASPCVDAGGAFAYPGRDLLNLARPAGTAADIGAYEGKTGVVAFALAASGNPESVTTANLEVKLAAASDLTVTVNYQVTGGSATAGAGNDFLLASGTLTFNPNVTSQSIAVGINHDLIEEADETIVVTLSGPANARLGSGTTHTYTIGNDDDANILVSPVTLTTTEAAGALHTATFTVSLTSVPANSAEVMVRVTSSAPSEGRVALGAGVPAASVDVVFNTALGYGAKTVTVTGQNEAIDDVDVTYVITTDPATCPLDPLYAGIDPPNVSVTNIDDDLARINTDVATITTTEGGATATFVVTLNSEPTHDVTVSVASSNIGDATVSPATLTFTPANWNSATGHSVVVTSVNDDIDDIDSPGGSNNVPYTITLGPASSSDSKYNGQGKTVAGTGVDNDTAGVAITPATTLATPRSIPEAGGTQVFSVVLTSQPANPVTIGVVGAAIASSNAGEGTVAPAGLSFSTSKNVPGGWNMPQSVTVTAVDDDRNHSATYPTNPDYTVTFPGANGDAKYQGLFAAVRHLRNTDDEVVGIAFTPTTGLTTTELGGTATFLAVLTSEPAAAVSFAVTSSLASEGLVSTADSATPAASKTLSFAPGTWNVPQVVTIHGQDDGTIDADQPYLVEQLGGATSTDSEYSGLLASDPSVEITNRSRDTPGVTITPLNLITSEAPGPQHTRNFAVRLNFPPTAATTVRMTSGNAGEGLLTSTSAPALPAAAFVDLDFPAGSASTIHIVTVTAVDDPEDDGNADYSITGTVTSTDPDYASIIPAPVSVTNVDDDAKGVVVAPTGGLTTTEGGGVAAFTVVLASRPIGGPVRIDLEVPDPGMSLQREGLIASSASPVPGSALSLHFTAANWSSPQLVTVTGQDDTFADGNAAYQVVFDALVGADYDDLPVVVAPSPVTVTNQDNDSAGVTVSETTLSINEGAPLGAPLTATYTVMLNSEPPSGSVTITIDPGSKAVVDTDPATPGLQGTLVFLPGTGTPTTANTGLWNSPLTVTVSAIDDDVADGNHTSAITHAAASIHANYDGSGVVIAGVTVQIADNDEAAINPGPDSIPATPALDLAELATGEASGSSPALFTYVLATKPRGNVTVLLASSDPGEALPVPDRLTFTPGNYDTAQTVSVYGVSDDLDDGAQSFSITATAVSADAAYDGIAVVGVDGSNADDDSAGVRIARAVPTLATTEAGGTATFTVRLDSQPTADVSVALASSLPGEGLVSPAAMVFTAANWDSVQVATVTGQADDVDADTLPDSVDDGDQAYSVTATASSADVLYGGPGATLPLAYTVATASPAASSTVSATSASLAALNTDLDTAGVTITPTSGLLTSEAGTNASYTIVLDSRPTDTVTITLTPVAGVLVTGQPAVPQLTAAASVEFAPEDWNQPVSVTVSAVDDRVAEGSAGTPHLGAIAHSAASNDPKYRNGGGGTLAALGNVTALITDNDTPGVVIAPASGLLTGEAGGTATFDVSLASRPTDDVSIAIATSLPTEGRLGVSPALSDAQVLTFTQADWDQPQTVTVTGLDDQIDDGDIAFLVITDPAVSADPRYSGLDATDVALANQDDDTAQVLIAESAHAVTGEDLSEFTASVGYTYTVVLASQPTGPVTVTLSTGIQVLADTAPTTPGFDGTLVFTATSGQAASGNSSGWDVPQTVRLVPVDDSNAEGTPHTGTVTHVVNGGGYSGVTVASVTVSITDDEESSPPVITLPSNSPTPTALAYVENGSPVLDGGATVADADSPDFNGGILTVAFTAGSSAGEDLLEINDQGSAPGQIGVSGNAVTFGGAALGSFSGGSAGAPLVITLDPLDAPKPAVQALLRNLVYRNTSDDPSTATRTVSITLNDGDGGDSAPVEKDIAVSAVDDVPVATVATYCTVANLALEADLVGSDAEGTALLYEIDLDNLPVRGLLDLVDPATGRFTYRPQAVDFGVYTFRFRVIDQGGAGQASPWTVCTLDVTGGGDARPLAVVVPPHETEAGLQTFDVVIDPASKARLPPDPLATPLRYTLVGLPVAGLTATIVPLSNTATLQSAVLSVQLTGAIGSQVSFGILVVDADAQSATYVPVTLQLVAVAGAG